MVETLNPDILFKYVLAAPAALRRNTSDGKLVWWCVALSLSFLG